MASIPLDADHEDKLLLSRDKKGVIALSITFCLDDVALRFAVLLIVLLGALKNDGALLLVGLRQS